MGRPYVKYIVWSLFKSFKRNKAEKYLISDFRRIYFKNPMPHSKPEARPYFSEPRMYAYNKKETVLRSIV